MIPVSQTRPHPHGNCLQACISGILDMQLNEVPDVTDLPDWNQLHETGYPIWYLALQKWLAGKGYALLEVNLEGRPWNPIPFEVACIMFGPHLSGCIHSIVGKCEGEQFFPIFDPLGGDPTKAFLNGRITSICMLVPIDPALMLYLGKAVDSVLRLATQLPPSQLKDEIRTICLHALKVPEPVGYLNLFQVEEDEKG